MTQVSTQWNDVIVHDLLHYPQRLAQHHTWSTVIAEAGGLEQLRQQLLEFPLKAKQRRVLEVILAHPEASVVRYTDLLAMHHATFHRQQNALCQSLSSFLNAQYSQPEVLAATSEPAPSAHVALPWTSFVGRQADIETLSTLLTNGSRWISLVGTGGVGKTRLALELAQHWLGLDSIEIHVLRFADVQRFEDVGLACAQQLQVSIQAEQSLEHALQHFFAQRRSLVILDNLEHLPAAGEWFATLFAEVAQLQVLATSRVRLNVAKEVIYEVDVLAYPPPAPNMDHVRSYPAVQLCLDRLEAVRLIDRDDEQLLEWVGQICHQVAGLPLAIELVAARAAEYSLDAIVAAIRTDLGLLADGPLDVDLRQQTMAATIGWSYRLLPAETQAILQQLSVFQAGWDVAAAAAVCGGEQELIDDHLALLLDNHLITQVQGHRYQTYAILEPIRQYVWALLDSINQQQLRLRHCDYYTALVLPSEDLLVGPDYALWSKLLHEAYPNIQLALHTARNEPEPLRLWQLLAALYRFWWQEDLIVEAQAWIMPQVPFLLQTSQYSYWQARALYTTLIFGLKDTPTYSRESTFHYLVQLAQIHQFKLIEAKAKNFYAIMIRTSKKTNQVNALLMDAINIYREIDDTVNILSPMLNYGNSMYGLKRLDEAYQIYAELLEKFKQNGDYDGIHTSMKNMAIMCIYLERYTEAEDIILDMLKEENIGQNLIQYNLLYMFLIKVYFFLGDYQKMHACAQNIYPLAIDNTIFIGRVLTICESIIYLAINKEYYPLVLSMYTYMLNAIHVEQYTTEWFQYEFIDQTRIVLAQYYENLEFIPDEDFVLDYHSFNDTMNYYIKLIYGF
ncbi:ATP-binding protein [Herpetosiphon llansteffanensis]|uniref:ATP-binding protein n=1 Tax=Herpetosiphon llansteffanensis TaxID=2094568 RepID=UPI000D7BE796|nr:NB-ARC domain-containing protein [Herpetosiphon llansteffanensis]